MFVCLFLCVTVCLCIVLYCVWVFASCLSLCKKNV